MRVADGGGPLVGTVGKCLGVREVGRYADVELEGRNVRLNRRGMSVNDSQSWKTLEGYLIPKQYNDGLNGADGKNMEVFIHGEGPFDEGAAVADELTLLHKPDTTVAGNVCPATSMLLADYQSALAETRPQWKALGG
jgi:hypothetical protein